MAEYKNRSVDRALTIMEVLMSASRGLLLNDVAEFAELDRITTFRLLRVLADRGYVVQDARSKRYSMTLNSVFHRPKGDLCAIAARLARQHFHKLHNEIGAAVNVASYEGANVYYRQVSLSPGAGVSAPQWSMLPSHATALGKVLLAHRPQSEVRKVYEYLPLYRYTSSTIRDLSDLEKELSVIRERGYAVSECELSEDIFCVAVPVETGSEDCRLALSTCRPANAVGKLNMDELIQAMKHTASLIGQPGSQRSFGQGASPMLDAALELQGQAA